LKIEQNNSAKVEQPQPQVLNQPFAKIEERFLNNEKNLNILKKLQKFKCFHKTNEFFSYTEGAKELFKKTKQIKIFFSSKLYNDVLHSKPYNFDGWKSPELNNSVNENNIITYDFNNTRCIKRIVDIDNIYMGEVESNNVPEGYGTKYYSNGKLLKGLWKNGNLTGWCLIINAGSTFGYHCNFYF
jgi:hypothetical protein